MKHPIRLYIHTHRATLRVLGVLAGILCIGAAATYVAISPYDFFSNQQSDLQQLEASVTENYIDLDGNVVELDAYFGKPLVVTSWASWSPYTPSDFAVLGRVVETFNDQVSIIAMNRMEQTPLIRNYIQTIAIPPSIVVLQDMTDHFYTTVAGYAMPETVVYDSSGTIVYHKRGTLAYEELDRLLQSLLE